MRTALLWIHVASGVAWMAGSAATAIATLILSPDSNEFHDFAVRALPTINRASAGAALCLLGTGITNFVLLGLPISFHFPLTFNAVLSAKIVLFAAMAVALALTMRAETTLKAAVTIPSHDGAATSPVGLFSVAATLAGAIALTLGLWLMGSL